MVGNILGKYFPSLKKSDYNFSLGQLYSRQPCPYWQPLSSLITTMKYDDHGYHQKLPNNVMIAITTYTEPPQLDYNHENCLMLLLKITAD